MERRFLEGTLMGEVAGLVRDGWRFIGEQKKLEDKAHVVKYLVPICIGLFGFGVLDLATRLVVRLRDPD